MSQAIDAKRKEIRNAIVVAILALMAIAAPTIGSDSSERAGRVAEFLREVQPSRGYASVVAVSRKGSPRSWFAAGAAGEQGTIPPDSTSQFRIGSVTKVFVALAALDLARKGRIELDAPVSRYIEGFRAEPRSQSASMTVRHLLAHTSGLPRGEQLGLTDFGMDSLVEATSGLHLLFPPGTNRSYSNLGYDLLGCILEKVAGMDAHDYILDSILAPLDMAGTGFMSRPRNSTTLVEPYPENLLAYCDMGDYAGGMYSSAGDLAKLTDWLLGERAGLPTALRDSLLGPVEAKNRVSSRASLFGQIVTTEFGDIDVRDGAVKGYRSAILLDRRNGLALVLLCSGLADLASMGLDAYAAGSGFAAGWLNWMRYDSIADSPVVARSQEDLKEWAGTYSFAFTPIQRPRRVALTDRQSLRFDYDSLSLETAEFDGTWNNVDIKYPRPCYLLFRCQARGTQPLIFARSPNGRRQILAKGPSGLSTVAVGMEGLEISRANAARWEGTWKDGSDSPRLVIRWEDGFLLLSDGRWNDPTVWKPLERLDDSTLVVSGVGRDLGLQLRTMKDSTILYRHAEILRRR